MLSAIGDVKKVIPNAKLIESSPDMVGISEIAEIIGCTRQNIRKLEISHRTFPTPFHEDKKSALYRLTDILEWYVELKSNAEVDLLIREVAEANKDINDYSKLGAFDSLSTKPDDMIKTLITNSPNDWFKKNVLA